MTPARPCCSETTIITRHTPSTPAGISAARARSRSARACRPISPSGSTYNVSGETLIDTGGNGGANVVFTAGSNVGPLGNLTIESGVVNFSTGTTITVASLNLTAGGGVGILTGSDTLDVSGLLTWTDGTMDGPGTTVAEGGLDLGLADGGYHVPELESRTLINQGTANWVGSGEIDLFAGSTFINQSGATFNEQTDDEIWSDVGVGEAPSGLFDNQGTFVVEGGGRPRWSPPSTTKARSRSTPATWELSGAGSSSGNFTMNAGTSLQLNMYYGIPYTAQPERRVCQLPPDHWRELKQRYAHRWESDAHRNRSAPIR